MIRTCWPAALLTLLFVSAAIAQHPSPDQDPIGRHLYPPELIMSHAQALALAEKQRDGIKAEVQRLQSRVFDLQWDLNEHTEKMVKLLQQSSLDEARILEQADKVMSLEREIKKAHLSMLIRLKNVLTAEQAAKLDAIRRAGR